MSIVHDIISLNRMERAFSFFWNLPEENKEIMRVNWPSQASVDAYCNERRHLNAMIHSKDYPGRLVDVDGKIQELTRCMCDMLESIQNYLGDSNSSYESIRRVKGTNW